MFVENNKIYRIKSSVAMVHLGNVVDLFKTNTRESVKIALEYDGIISLMAQLDGVLSVEQIMANNKSIESSEFYLLLDFLNEKNVIIEVDIPYNDEIMEKYGRIINLLEDYNRKTSEVLSSIFKVQNARVLIIGLGAVGTWVATSLAMSGVKNFILIDDDVVDISNLHRQDCYFEDDVGRYKVDCVAQRLQEINEANVFRVQKKIHQGFFNDFNLDFDVAINCADYPSVDVTSLILGEYCMQHEKKHLIGGGYNLHLSLIGQAVIPGKTACIKCFDMYLSKINNADLHGVKKLERATRKIGSFGPLCSISASITACEAFKIIAGHSNSLATVNKRIEFRLSEMDFFPIDVPKQEKCTWCGDDGLYTR